jgi:hypothetical protein
LRLTCSFCSPRLEFFRLQDYGRPQNDVCEYATKLPSLPANFTGNTEGAVTAPFTNVSICRTLMGNRRPWLNIREVGGHWFSYVGTGNVVRLTSGVDYIYRGRYARVVGVFRGDCGNRLSCVSVFSGPSDPTVYWGGEVGVMYHIVIFGAKGISERSTIRGDFTQEENADYSFNAAVSATLAVVFSSSIIVLPTYLGVRFNRKLIGLKTMIVPKLSELELHLLLLRDR